METDRQHWSHCKKQQYDQDSPIERVTGNMIYVIVHLKLSLSNQIKQWKKKNPDQVNKMPIERGILLQQVMFTVNTPWTYIEHDYY